MNNQELQKTQSANSQIALQKPNNLIGSCQNVNILDGNYILYSNGKIYSVRRNKFLKPMQDNPKWYYHFILMGKKYYLHRLLAEYFIPNPSGKKYINHINGDKLDFNLQNLEWVTCSENAKHAYKNKLNYRPSNSGKAKIQISQFDISDRFMRNWDSISDAARHIKSSEMGIIRAMQGKSKTCKGYKWKYL